MSVLQGAGLVPVPALKGSDISEMIRVALNAAIGQA